MLESILDFLRKLQVESQVHPGFDIGSIFVIIILASAFVITFIEYRAHTRHDREEKEREEKRAIREQKISREASAKGLYRDYLRVALEYPELSSAKYNKDDPIDADKYDTFLSIMLYSFDEGVNYTESEFYIPVIKWQIRVHDDCIRQILHKDVPKKDSFRSVYSPKFLEYVDEAFAEIDEEKASGGKNNP
jgi:hypothetical protein